MPLSSRKEVGRFVHRKLLFRLRRLALLFILIVAIVVDEVLLNYISWYMAAGGFLLGLILGVVVGRHMHQISWDAETSKAITRMDSFGIILLLAYLIFSILRRWIFSHWLQGYTLTAFSLSIGAGGMLGRLFVTRKKIRQILKDAGFLHPPKHKQN